MQTIMWEHQISLHAFLFLDWRISLGSSPYLDFFPLSKSHLSLIILPWSYVFREHSWTVLDHTVLLSCSFSSKLVSGSYFGGPYLLPYMLCILLWCFNFFFLYVHSIFLIRLKLIEDEIEFPMGTLTEFKTNARYGIGDHWILVEFKQLKNVENTNIFLHPILPSIKLGYLF